MRPRTPFSCRFLVLVLAGLFVAHVTGCASSPPGARRAPVKRTTVPRAVTPPSGGLASYYAAKFDGRKTASGETFSNRRLTAAHRTLPFGTKVRVTNTSNRRSVTVRINDRGPFVRGRVIDLSQAAARELDMVRAGVAPVRLQVVGQGRGRAVARLD